MRAKVLSILAVFIMTLTGCATNISQNQAAKDTFKETEKNDSEMSIAGADTKTMDNATESIADEYLQSRLTIGTEEYRGFQMDNVLHSDLFGEIHYHIYVPDSYDENKGYTLYVTLLGYEGLYFQGVGVNLQSENFAFEA